jgi:hypothetical protein
LPNLAAPKEGIILHIDGMPFVLRLISITDSGRRDEHAFTLRFAASSPTREHFGELDLSAASLRDSTYVVNL